jgi:general secretion pathway protein J
MTDTFFFSPVGRVARCTSLRQQGFTLLELLVAMTLFAMLATMMYGGVGFGVRAWEASSRAEHGAGDIGTVQVTLRRAVSQVELAFYRDARQSAQKTKVAFLGHPDRMAFVAPVSQFVGIGGRYHVGFEIENAGAAQNLVLKWEAFSVETLAFELSSKAEKEVLVQNISGLRTSYFGRASDGAGKAWVDSWKNEHELPLLIRLEVVFPSGDPRVWPEFVIPIMTTRKQL